MLEEQTVGSLAGHPEDDPIHEGIRQRGAALAAAGPAALAARIDERMLGIGA